MKALTIHAPWAWAIVAGHKRVENRTWRTNHRGWLAIHAGSSKSSDAAAEALLDSLGIHRPERWDASRGALLGVVRVEACDAIEDAPADPFAVGPILLRLADARPCRVAVPCGGALGLWNLSDSQHAALVASLGFDPAADDSPRLF